MSVHAVYDFSADEHYRAMRAAIRHTPARWLSWGFAALATIFVAMKLREGWGRMAPLALLVNVLPWILVGIFWVAMTPLSQRSAARKLPSRDPSARGPQERMVDAEG